jgi:hypothetical protein
MVSNLSGKDGKHVSLHPKIYKKRITERLYHPLIGDEIA